ncbi:type III restriction endonuclease subunit R, partial [Pseudomonas aeruginosa]
LDAPRADDNKTSVQVQSGAHTMLGLSEGTEQPAAEQASTFGEANNTGLNTATQKSVPIFTTDAEKQAARVVMEVIGKYETKRDLVSSSRDLLKEEVQEQIKAEVAERLKPQQGSLLEDQD